jgi:hypothetical protein
VLPMSPGRTSGFMEGAMGIEPTSEVAIPQNHC